MSNYILDHDQLLETDDTLDQDTAKEGSLSRSKSNLDVQAEIQRNYEKLQRNLSQEFQRYDSRVE